MQLNTELEQFIYTIWDFNSESGEWPEYYKGVSEMMQIRDARIRAEALEDAADRAVKYSCQIVMAFDKAEQDGLRDAILAGDDRLLLPPDVLMDARQETMHVETGERRSVKAIRVEALKDAADRAWREVDTWIHIEGDDNGYAKVHMEGLLKTAILAGEVKE